jgi:hypothetical protein
MLKCKTVQAHADYLALYSTYTTSNIVARLHPDTHADPNHQTTTYVPLAMSNHHLQDGKKMNLLKNCTNLTYGQ